MNSLNDLPETLTTPRTDAVYNCHGYLTKVPIAAIEPFIAAFTEPGDTVADTFAGSGMTGLAAMRQGRRAHLSDIAVLGRHITTGYLTKTPHSKLRQTAKLVMDQTRCRLGDLYMTRRSSDGAEVEMVRTIWSFTYICPSCATSMVYFHHLTPNGAAPKSCSSCPAPFVRRNWGRGEDVPVRVVVQGVNGRLTEQDVSDVDLRTIVQALKDERLKQVPSLTIEKHREMYSRSGLGKAGLTETSAFFSARNAIALLELWNVIASIDDAELRQKLRFAFTGILPRASRRYQWSAKRPLNAQNQTYYISPVYFEWNVLDLFERKVEASIRSDGELFSRQPLLVSSGADVIYTIASADRLSHLADESVDYVFTDPPFGSNIFYSDMHLFQEAWLGEKTDHTSEAVVHTTGKHKTGAAERYECLLKAAFSEAFRVLKPGRYMSVVFGNSSGKIWGLVQRAIRDAGFKSAPVHVAILDKGQRSVKGLNSGSEGVVTVDLVLTVQKPSQNEAPGDAHPLTNGDTHHLINEAIRDLSSAEAENPSHVYARILRKAIQKHLILDDLHLGDVLVALRQTGYSVDPKSGRLKNKRPVEALA